ncbi:Uncharacterized protein APZ42_008902 [Daphnia magna]|uniref:Uncharacterized protein n=1 Tax=Daphnia magna TaxID=35525 RepID=A0A162CZN1_9CRUS|nr:Uncharacterized protein APZ42_008902 [Daphnia magna]
MSRVWFELKNCNTATSLRLSIAVKTGIPALFVLYFNARTYSCSAHNMVFCRSSSQIQRGREIFY